MTEGRGTDDGIGRTPLASLPPSRFTDGRPVHVVLDELERELGATVRLVGYDASYEDDWSIVVGDAVVETIERRRRREGFSVFEMTSEEFETVVEAAL